MSDENAEAQTAEPEAKEPSLDELLNEWQDGDEKPEGQGDKKPAGEAPDKKTERQEPNERLDRALSYIEQQQQREIRESTTRDVTAAVNTLREHEALSKVPDRLLRGALYDLAESDKRFLGAWQARDRDPKRFERLIRAAAEDLAAEFTQAPDEQLTEDREAARASVRSQSGPARPAEPDLKSMSDDEIIDLTDREAAANRS